MTNHCVRYVGTCRDNNYLCGSCPQPDIALAKVTTDRRVQWHDGEPKQIGGSHYSNKSIQPIDYIMGNDLDFAEGSAIKYITRHKEKGGADDIRKAIHFCEFILKYHYDQEAV